MKTINAQRALEMLQSEKVSYSVKSRITELMQMHPKAAADHVNALASIFDSPIEKIA